MRTPPFILALLLVPVAARASGFMISEQGARALGRADAFAATADDPSAVFYNPAGIVTLPEVSCALGFNVVTPAAELRDDTTNLETEARTVHHWAPVLYGSYRLGDLVAVGLGVNSPFGLGISWPSTSPGRAIVRTEKLETVAVTPVVAFDLRPYVAGLSLGAGIDVVPASLELKRDILFGDETGKAHLGATAIGVGGHVGARYEPPAVRGMTLGLVWHSPVNLDFEGKADFDAPAAFRSSLPKDGDISTTLTLPHELTLGVGYDLVAGLNAEVDVSWVGWSTYDSTVIHLPDGSRSTSAHEWKDTLAVRVGLEYALAPLSVRVGYAFDPSPVPAVTLDPTLPDANRQVTTLGIGVTLPADAQVDAGLLYLWPQSRHTADALYRPPFKAEYEISAWIVSLNFGVSLGKPPPPADVPNDTEEAP